MQETWKAIGNGAVRLVGVTLAVTAGLASARPVTARNDVVIETSDGQVRGFEKAGIQTFLGVPYAAPPVGELRWKAPVPPARHSQLETKRFTANCAQSNTLAVFTGPASVEEDCLYLNIFTTGTRPARGKARPVIVWFHGGGNFAGTASDYDGGRLATGGPDGTPAVVVTVNYRLGLLGFLAHPALMKDGEAGVNFGTLDQQAALRWVRQNIAAFGGDPARVTIAGQSGGSVDVHANVVSPLAAGLINGAIFMSAPAAGFVPLNAAKSRGQAFAEAAGCPGTSVEAAACLRSLSVPRILQLQGTVKDNGPYLDPANQNVIVDGTVITSQPGAAYAAGKFNKVPVMGGATHDELTFVMGYQQYLSGPPPGAARTYASLPTQRAFSPDDYAERIKSQFGPAAPAVLAKYTVEKYGNAMMAYNRVLGDPLQCSSNLAPLKVLARSTPTYGWVFSYQNAPFYLPKMEGFRPLSAHTIDIQFLFDGYHGGPLGVNVDQATGMPRGLNAEERRLSDELIGFWTNFAATGNPNGRGNAPWPAIRPDAPILIQQDVPLGTMTEAQLRTTYQCDFWDSLSRR